MRNVAMAIVLVSVASACELSTEPEVRTSANQLEQRATWQGSLTGTSAFPNVNGSAQFVEFRSYMNASTTVNGIPAGRDSVSWRVFAGTCAAPDDQFGPNQAYPNLKRDGSGSVTVTRVIAGALDSLSAYNVRVSTIGTPVQIVACGNLQRN